MLLTSLEMAQWLEEADIFHITRQVEACAQIFPDYKSFAAPIGHGVAAITLPSFGPKLNRIVGYGRAGRVSDKDLPIIEDLFAKNGVDTEINLCPLADSSAFEVLASRGYSVIGFINYYVRVLTDEDLKEVKVDGIVTSRVSAERAQEFPSWSLAGYRDTGKAELLLEALARSAALRADTSLYTATVDAKVAGSAGFDLASIAARPGDGSCRNIERAGFSLAYTTARCVKAHK
jgi:hypothetical protein